LTNEVPGGAAIVLRINGHMPVLLCIVLLVALSTVAVADVTLSYSGETPTSGMSSYSGDNASGELWDYVYNISGSQYSGPEGPEPDIWAIYCPYEPSAIYDEDGDWTSSWDNEIATGEYGGRLDGTALEGQPAVVWQYGEFNEPPLGTFHYQSEYEPQMASYVISDGPSYSGSGSQWSASPEPASMLLTLFGVAGVAAWRRRMDPS
jgi:MYXO-CTERM domain-containing protein